MDSLIWLGQMSNMQLKADNRPDYLPSTPTNLELLAELIYINGGQPVIKSIGNVIVGSGVYGRLGLTAFEAQALLTKWAVLTGIHIGRDDGTVARSAALYKIQKEIERVERLGTSL